LESSTKKEDIKSI
jgi:hypothetical protein